MLVLFICWMVVFLLLFLMDCCFWKFFMECIFVGFEFWFWFRIYFWFVVESFIEWICVLELCLGVVIGVRFMVRCVVGFFWWVFVVMRVGVFFVGFGVLMVVIWVLLFVNFKGLFVMVGVLFLGSLGSFIGLFFVGFCFV